VKTTIDLPENLLAEARLAAERRGWSVRLFFEESLRSFLQQTAERPQSFRLAHTVVQGHEFPALSFAEMLDATVPNRSPEP